MEPAENYIENVKSGKRIRMRKKVFGSYMLDIDLVWNSGKAEMCVDSGAEEGVFGTTRDKNVVLHSECICSQSRGSRNLRDGGGGGGLENSMPKELTRA